MIEKDSKIRILFNDQGDLRQVMDIEELYNTSTETQTKLSFFIAHIMEISDAEDGYVGPNKDKENALRKANQRFEGDTRFLTDIVRGKIIVDNVDQLESIMKIFKDLDSPPLRDSGIHVALEKNNFETPKAYTGYRGLSYKLAVPTGDDNKPHIVELQIVLTAMEYGNDTTYIMDPDTENAAYSDDEARMSIYDGTHFHKRAAEDIYRDAAHDYLIGTRKNPELTDEEHDLAAHHYAVCLYYNAKIAHEEGCDRLLLDKDTHAFTPEMEKELLTHMTEIGIEP